MIWNNIVIEIADVNEDSTLIDCPAYIQATPFGVVDGVIVTSKYPARIVFRKDCSEVFSKDTMYAILYHELGHLMCGHLSDRHGDLYEREIEADKYFIKSGSISAWKMFKANREIERFFSIKPNIFSYKRYFDILSMSKIFKCLFAITLPLWIAIVVAIQLNQKQVLNHNEK